MENFGKRPFFQADLAGLGKCRTGGFGRIGVYRVKTLCQGLKGVNESCESITWVMMELQATDNDLLSNTFSSLRCMYI